jgi:Tol biopolymer transport system component
MKRVLLLSIAVVIAVCVISGCEGALPDDLKGEIAFISSVDNDGAFDIYIISLPSKEVRQLTHTEGNGVENVWLDWCPAGPIAFASTRDGNYEIYMINPDGTGEVRLTENDYDDFYPTLRWDGKQIAFSSSVATKKGPPQKDIFIMDIATRKTKRITDTPEDEVALSWSPDGKKIAYSKYVMGQLEIFIYDFGTGESTRITYSPGEDVNPDWTSDSKYLVFSSDRDDTVHVAGERLYSIYMADVELKSSPEQMIHKDRYTMGSPSVSPDNKWVACQFMREDWNWMYIGIYSTTDPKKSYTLVKNIFFNRNPVWKPVSQ